MDTDLLKSLVPFFYKSAPLYVKKGQVIIRPEDTLNNIYFIEKGFVRFYHLSEDGKEYTFLIYKPGYVFPIIYTFTGKATRYYFEAMTPVTLRRTTREEFGKILEENSPLSNLINKELVIRFEELLEKEELLSFGNASRIVAYILRSCALQFGEPVQKYIVIQLKLRHQDIASMAGLTRETVSIEMKKFENEGLIQYRRGRIQIREQKVFNKATGLDF